MRQNELETKTFVVWAIAAHQLALPIEAVLRVVPYPQRPNSDLGKMGFIQIENHMIKIIDLYQYIGSEKPPQFLDQPILMITSSPAAKLYGILACEPPTLMNFSRDMLQTLPKANHQPRLLDIVSHAVVTKQHETPDAVFLLDMRRVLETVLEDQT